MIHGFRLGSDKSVPELELVCWVRPLRAFEDLVFSTPSFVAPYGRVVEHFRPAELRYFMVEEPEFRMLIIYSAESGVLNSATWRCLA